MRRGTAGKQRTTEGPAGRPWEDPDWLERVLRFAEGLGIGPEHREMVVRGFTHRSLGDVSPHGHNERLEFLGDSVLALLVNDYLYRQHPDYTEGQLTRAKAAYVSEPSLAEAAAVLDLGSLLAMAAADEAAGTRSRPGTLSDIFESVLAMLYLARGLEAAREFVHRELIQRIDPSQVWDHKSRLQELLQAQRNVTPVYQTEMASGPIHSPVFASTVLAGEEVLGSGTGRNKKLAEQAAAADALLRLKVEG